MTVDKSFMQMIAFLSALAIAGTLASCTEENDPVQQYGNSRLQALHVAKKTARTANLQQVRRTIQEFRAANDRYPADLDELSRVSNVTLKNDEYEYDPATGTLTEKQ
jgi:hypothetical protein